MCTGPSSDQSCHARTITGRLTLHLDGDEATATLMHGHVTLARGHATRGHDGAWRLSLRNRHSIRAGRYTLVLNLGRRGLMHLTIRIR